MSDLNACDRRRPQRRRPRLLAGALLLVVTGCSPWPNVWVEETQTLPVPADTRELAISTHNGAIRHQAAAATREIVVTATRKGGGANDESARAALAAIEVFAKPGAAGEQKVGWRWKTPKRLDWGATVSFDVTAPAAVAVDVDTHNGAVRVEGAAASVNAVTHNGRVDVKSSTGPLYAETHNGDLCATYEGPQITLLTHNGGITADLSACKSVKTALETHNGPIELVVADDIAGQVSCRTHNGAIVSEVPLKNVSNSSSRELDGTLGAGGPAMASTTHNGSIRIRKAGA